MSLRPLLLSLAIVAGFAAVAEVRALDREERERQFKEEVQPFLATYCVKCHKGEKPESNLSFDPFQDPHAIATKDRKHWGKVLGMVRTGAMPPEEEKKRPPAEQAMKVAAWLEATLKDIDCTSPDPGRVTIRRLNRVEYRNTVRDLLGVDFKPADDFPADDVGYGFDNIGDVLTLPPVLMEKYLAAAEEIADKAIVTKGVKQPLDKQINAADFEGAGNRILIASRSIASEGECSTQITFPLDGEYVLQISAHGDQAGPDPVKMGVAIDKEKPQEVIVRASAPETHEVKLKLKAGVRRISLSFLNDYYMPNAEDPKLKGDRNLVVHYVKIVGPTGYQSPDLPESHKRLIFVYPTETVSRREVTRQIVERFLARAFRRDVAKEEVDRYSRLAREAANRGATFEESIHLMVQAALVSPQFLFRLENDPPSAPEIRKLNDFELATRLSYLLWSSMPDDELLRLAHEGQLARADVTEQQVKRMLADPKARALVDNFAGQWLELRRLADVMPDKKRYPDWDDDLRAAMRKETELFFESIVREDRSILDLLGADYTFVNERLARHYGLKNVAGPEFRKVSLTYSVRGGLLGQASFLTVTSNPTRTSPVKRGKWVLENLLNDPPPAPPPNVPELAEQEGALTGTLRQKMEQHRANPSCATCHARLDPLGFALENFDGIGGYRETEGDAAIDSSGELPDGEKFKGAAGLRKLLLTEKRASFVRCVAEKMLTYALGRGLEYYDRCAVDAIAAQLEKDDHRFSRLITAIALSEPFTKRRTK